MAATNVFQNVTGLTVNGVSITSVLEIRVDDNTQYLQDGSDNDESFTFSQRQAYQCRVTLRLRDGVEAHKVRGLENVTVTWTDVAAAGTNKTGTISNCSFGQPTEGGAWQQLKEFTVAGVGGSYTLS